MRECAHARGHLALGRWLSLLLRDNPGLTDDNGTRRRSAPAGTAEADPRGDRYRGILTASGAGPEELEEFDQVTDDG